VSGISSLARNQALVTDGATPSTAEEVVAGHLHRLGGYIELDGRVSWAPSCPGQYQPVNCYVISRDDQNYLIDTGVAGHRAAVVDQITGLLPRGRPLTCFLTRTEYQCVGNLGAVYKARGMDELVSGGRNPFAAYEDVARDLKDSVKRKVLEIGRKKAEPMDASGDLLVIPPLIRVLNTNWIYDRRLKTLFSSDWFGHTSVADPAEGAVIDSLENDSTTYESAKEHILCRYFWLPQATTRPLSTWLEQIFTDYDIEIIAPTFGCVLKGKDVVGNHYEIVMDLLHKIGR
jgi:hypothetical protein